MEIGAVGYVEVKDCYREPEFGRFVVTGFDGAVSGESGVCSVLMKGNKEAIKIPIDANNRIRIGKRWYSREKWDH